MKRESECGTKMTAKEFLQQVYSAHHEVDIKLEQAAKLKSLAMRTTTAINQTPGGNLEASSRIEESVARMDEISTKLADDIRHLVEISSEVYKAIDQVKDTTERLVLKYRYLCFFSWQQISFIMKISVRQVYRVHAVALEKIFPMSLYVT